VVLANHFCNKGALVETAKKGKLTERTRIISKPNIGSFISKDNQFLVREMGKKAIGIKRSRRWRIVWLRLCGVK